MIAPLLAQEGQLLVVLDALGDDFQIEALADADDRRDQALGPGLVACDADVRNERLVDLDAVQGKTAQIIQGRIPGAEIVRREMREYMFESLRNRKFRKTVSNDVMETRARRSLDYEMKKPVYIGVW